MLMLFTKGRSRNGKVYTKGVCLRRLCIDGRVEREVPRHIQIVVRIPAITDLTMGQRWINLGGHQIITPRKSFLADIFYPLASRTIFTTSRTIMTA